MSRTLAVRTWTHTWARLADGPHAVLCDLGNDPCAVVIRGGDAFVRHEAGDGWVAYVCAPCARTSGRLRQVAA